MKAKDKALELINFFSRGRVLAKEEMHHVLIDAMVLCSHVIDASPLIFGENDPDFEESIRNNLNYWIEVRKELEKQFE